MPSVGCKRDARQQLPNTSTMGKAVMRDSSTVCHTSASQFRTSNIQQPDTAPQALLQHSNSPAEPSMLLLALKCLQQLLHLPLQCLDTSTQLCSLCSSDCCLPLVLLLQLQQRLLMAPRLLLHLMLLLRQAHTELVGNPSKLIRVTWVVLCDLVQQLDPDRFKRPLHTHTHTANKKHVVCASRTAGIAQQLVSCRSVTLSVHAGWACQHRHCEMQVIWLRMRAMNSKPCMQPTALSCGIESPASQVCAGSAGLRQSHQVPLVHNAHAECQSPAKGQPI